MTKRSKALAAIIACVLFWGFSFISIKIAVAVFPPMTLGALRFALALIFLFIIKRKYAPDEKIRKKDIPLLAGAGFTGVTLYFFCENNGVLLVPASEASIIIAAIPVITLVAEGLREKLVSRKKNEAPEGKNRRTFLPAAGALLSVAGVALVAGVSFTLSGTYLGYIFMAGACVGWVCYCFLTRPLFQTRSRVYIVFWQALAGFAGFLPFAFFELSAAGLPAAPDISVWGHVAFLGVFCSALGYWFYAVSLEVLGVAVSSVFINFIPAVSAVGGFFILGERLQPLQWAGAALVLAGAYLAVAGGGKRNKA